MQTPLYQCLHSGVKTAHSAHQNGLTRYHTHRVHIACMHGAQADDGRIHRLHVARDNALHCRNNVPRYQHRVNRHIGVCTVAAFAGDGDGDAVCSGHHGARVDTHHAGRHSRPVVHGIRCSDGETVKQTVCQHRRRATAPFFCGLKYQHGRATKIARLGQVAGRAHQHGGVAIMAAAMHAPGGGRLPSKSVVL